MGSPTIFSGKYTKLLTQKGLLQQGGAVNQFDGPRNYIANSSLESGTLDGWNRVKTTITSNLPSGIPTIGKLISVAPSITAFSAFSGTAPFDTYGLRFGNILSTVVAGEGIISDAFTIEPGDRGKVLTFKLYYQSDLGASTDNWSGVLGSQTWAVYIYDQTAGAWLQPAGFLGMNQNSGVGIVSGTFQSSVVSGQQYRIAVIALRNTTSTSALQIDNIYVGSQTAPIGPVVTDWVSYTPTGTWVSGATYTGKYRRVGDSIQCSVKIAITGPVTATDLQVSIPSGLTIDSSKMASGDFLQSVFGTGHGFRSTGGTHYNFQIGYASPTLLFFTYQNQLTSQVVSVANTTPFTWANGDAIHATFMVPVAGASSNVQLSNDTDTRVVAFNAYDGAQVAITNTTAVLPLGTTSVDTHAVRSGNTYVIPVSGFYRLSAKSTTKFSVGNTTFTHALIPYKNGVAQFGGDYGNADGVNSANLEFYYQAINSIFRLNAGDIIDFRYFTDYTGVATTYLKYCSIERLSGPSVVAASETVAARYFTSAGPVINNTQPIITYGSKVYDSHNAMSGNTYNVPVSGKYRVTQQIFTASSSFTAGTIVEGVVRKNSVNNAVLGGFRTPALLTGTIHTTGSAELDCVAGDQLTFAIYSDVASSLGTTPAGVYNFVTISRIGN